MRFVDVNSLACRLLGYSREELLVMGPADLMPESREELERNIDLNIASATPITHRRGVYFCKDGSTLPFEATRCLLQSAGQWLLVVIARDIRDRIAAEQEQRQAEERIRNQANQQRLIAELGRERTVVLSTHVGGWADFDLPGFVQDVTGAQAIMDNDANAGAIGEGEFGAGKGCSPLFYMTLGTGIGGGIYDRGRVWRGADSYGGEIGHLTIRPGGPECLCGARDCFERMCCGLWLQRDHGRSAKELMRDSAFVNNYVVDLALGLKAAIMLLNPARIVIGGGISKAGDRLFVPLRSELRRQVTGWSAARIDVVPAALEDDSVLYGAFALARR
jgi:glucokinase